MQVRTWTVPNRTAIHRPVKGVAVNRGGGGIRSLDD